MAFQGLAAANQDYQPSRQLSAWRTTISPVEATISPAETISPGVRRTLAHLMVDAVVAARRRAAAVIGRRMFGVVHSGVFASTAEDDRVSQQLHASCCLQLLLRRHPRPTNSQLKNNS